MAKNSLFAILLRSSWWISAAIAAAIVVLAWVLLPPAYRGVGVFGGLPFVVIAAMAAWRQRHVPSAAEVDAIVAAVGAMAWQAFADLLEQSFRRDGYTVRRCQGGGAADFELERRGRTMLVGARRWKAARTGVDPLRDLQAARDAADAPDALYVCLGTLTDAAQPFAAEHRISIWQAAELAQALRGLPLRTAPAR